MSWALRHHQLSQAKVRRSLAPRSLAPLAPLAPLVPFYSWSSIKRPAAMWLKDEACHDRVSTLAHSVGSWLLHMQRSHDISYKSRLDSVVTERQAVSGHGSNCAECVQRAPSSELER